MTINNNEYINTSVIKSLYRSNAKLNPEYLANMAASDIQLHLVNLREQNSPKASVALHNIYATSVTLGLSKLSKIAGKVESAYKPSTSISNNDIEILERSAKESIEQLRAIDVGKLK